MGLLGTLSLQVLKTSENGGSTIFLGILLHHLTVPVVEQVTVFLTSSWTEYSCFNLACCFSFQLSLLFLILLPCTAVKSLALLSQQHPCGRGSCYEVLKTISSPGWISPSPSIFSRSESSPSLHLLQLVWKFLGRWSSRLDAVLSK